MSALGGPLTALKVKHARKRGMLADGNGLYLQVTHANARSWIFRYYRNGKSREMGLGSLNRPKAESPNMKAKLEGQPRAREGMVGRDFCLSKPVRQVES